MNETLTELALDYGWGCPRCEGGQRVLPADDPRGMFNAGWKSGRCPDCHGNRVTPSDADRFMDKVALVVRRFPAYVEQRAGVLLSRGNNSENWFFRDSCWRKALGEALDSLQRAKAVNP